jgi:signal transduction histidine kinase/ligand-binding sensor domain-containing protein
MDGLARFDGVRFVTFGPRDTPELKQNRIDALLLDAQGTLWIETHDGSLTSWRKGVFTYEWKGPAETEMTGIFSRSNETLFATYSGELAVRRGPPDGRGEWELLRPANRTTGLAYHQDGAGNLWYYTRENAIGRLVGTNFVLLPGDSGLPGETVNCLASDRAGRIWAGTDKGIAVWNGKRFIDQTPTNGEPELSVSMLFCSGASNRWVLGNGRFRECSGRSWVAEAETWGKVFSPYTLAVRINEDRQGVVWFRHQGKGLFYAQPDGTMDRISSETGLPGDRVNCWLEDHEGNIWAGVDRGGLARLREKRLEVIRPAAGGSGQAVSSVCEDNEGSIWIGGFGSGFSRWQDGEVKPFSLPEGTVGNFVYCAYPGQDNQIWLSAGREDLFVYTNGQIQRPPSEVHGIKAILTGRDGRVWLGKNTGLACLNKGQLRTYSFRNGLPRTAVHALAEDKRGDLWVGGGDGTLYRLNGERFAGFRPQDSLAGEAIWSLLADDEGTLWVGTVHGGLLRFRDGRFTRFTSKNGLPSDTICQILEDGGGRLWFGSQKGIFRVSKSAFQQVASGQLAMLPCVTYGNYDGLPTSECSGSYQPSAWRSRDGRLWFATLKGVVGIQPEEIPVNEVRPSVLIEEVLVDGKPAVAPGEPVPGGALRIGPGKHVVAFRYTAPSFVVPERVAFRYQLEGSDNDWVDARDARLAEYRQLQPGDYRFRVIACNNDGVWNEAGAAIRIRILPHFWQTWWFATIAGLSLFSGLVGVVRYEATRKLRRRLALTEQQRAVERDRARIAKDIHDDLGAGLTQIMLQSAIARRGIKEEAQPQLAQISETARELIRSMDEIVWAVNPQNDTLDGLGTYISKFAHEYLTTAGVRCRLDVPEHLPGRPLSSETRHNLFLAVKEALNNVLKHAGATEVWLRLIMEASGFTISIADNGRGFVSGGSTGSTPTEGRIASGQGLRNMARRLEAIGGVCNVTSEPGKGTRVELTVKNSAGAEFGEQHESSELRVAKTVES